MKPKAVSLKNIIEGRLCTGCGACAAMAPDVIEMAETADENRRPRFMEKLDPKAEAKILMACPGANSNTMASTKTMSQSAWGPVLEVWEGYAASFDIRHKASSGGAVTALALFAIEHEGYHGALHIKARKDNPVLNEASLSLNRKQLMEGAGSRYAPASVCDRLSLVSGAPQKCVVIGKPCDIAGALAVASHAPELKAKLGLTISIFCAGTPSHQGTKALIERLAPSEEGRLVQLDYRGDGWPGDMRARWFFDGREETTRISYAEG